VGSVRAVRVAALYDVHGNLPALEAVLAEVEQLGVDEIVCGGDICAGPMPREVLELLQESTAQFVRGNADRDLLGWPAERLTSAQLDFLRGLPLSLSLEVDRLGTVAFCHATPRSDDEIVTRLTPDEELEAALEGRSETVIVCGHVHTQYDRRVGEHRVINAGSVGLPYEGRPAAFWTLLGPDVEHRSTAYDLDAAVRRMDETGYPGLDDHLSGSLLEPLDPDEVARYFESIRGA
jgi:putative phosphoesterase